ncbi:MAG: amylo-alpha-1,6-glucosidase, partial [Gemmatimonadales bacterium]
MKSAMDPRLLREWLEPDGLGGFASGTVGLIRTRRYHALLLAATTPPTGRNVLVNGFEAWIEAGEERVYLTPQHYASDVLDLSAVVLVAGFSPEPWPAWTWRLENGSEIRCELFVKHGSAIAAIRWWASRVEPGWTLAVRPFLSGRDAHALHRENDSFRFDTGQDGERLHWKPYDSVPGITSLSNGKWIAEPLWYRDFMLDEERARGLDCVEDLAAPGVFRWDLSAADGYWILAADDLDGSAELGGPAAAVYRHLRDSEQKRRAKFAEPLLRAADGYIVKRGDGRTIIAGYPWFTDWGRDTFIALRGLCLATGRLDDARSILLQWAGMVSEGMLPSRFAEEGGRPEFNSVDGSLWFVIVVREYLLVAAAQGELRPADRRTLLSVVETILRAYCGGTRYGIMMDSDCLLNAGEPGVQLTWMDARVGDWVVTPRMGKPVEVQALWINALHAASVIGTEWAV